MNRDLFSKNYILTVVAATLFYTTAFMLNSVCARYSMDIGGSKTMSGFVVCCFTLSSFFTRPLWGWITDRYSRRLVCIGGGVLCTAATALLLMWGTLPVLMLSRIVFGCGYSALTTAAATVVCDIAPKDDLQQAISVYGITNVRSQAVAPALALWLYDYNFKYLIIVVLVVAVFVPAIFMFVRYNEKEYISSDKKFETYEKTALPAAYTIVFFALSVSAINSFIPVFAREKGIQGDVYMTQKRKNILLMTTRLINTKITAILGSNKVFYAGDIIYISSFVILSFTANLLFLLLAAALYGAGAGFIHPVVNTAAVKKCSRDRRGLATGTFMMSQDLGMTVGAVSWGFISEKLGFSAVYITVSILLLVMMYVFRRFLSGILE